MKGTIVIKKWPAWAKKHSIQPDDFIYLAGDKIKVLRKGN
jgi:hypothetical protein